MSDRAGEVTRAAFGRLPPGPRLAILHRLGRFAPWESGFDFTPPPLGAGQQTGAPDFVGIGAQKAGTTWWFELLSEQPGVFSRPDLHKERHFFDRYAVEPFTEDDARRYQGWFPRPHGMVTGEWTPDYLTLPWVAPLLARAAPSTRLLLLLRDPVERFRSGLEHQERSGLQSTGAVMADALGRGFYHRALVRWLEHFERDQLLVLQYERCRIDRQGQLSATLRFLGLEGDGGDGSGAADPRPGAGAGLGAALSAGHRDGRDRRDRPPMDEDTRRRLVDLYLPDVLQLAEAVPELDLGLWPNFAYVAGPESTALAPPEPASPPSPRVGGGVEGSRSPTRRR